MKRLILTFLVLLSTFFISWQVKANMPINRPENLEEEEEAAWYEGNYTAPAADDEWKLDPSIPSNYIPVPGQDNLFMVVDDNGTILGYRKRTLLEDGTWKWEDTNPDIPEGYEPVDGLKDVYKVTDADGTVHYVKYIRNDDDTYCFVECDENGVPLDIGTDASKPGKNYVKQTGNIYAYYNDNGVLIGYRERAKQDNGTFAWKEAANPFSSSGSSFGGLTYSGGNGSNSSGQGQAVLSQGEDTPQYTYATDGNSAAWAKINQVTPDDGYSEETENPDGTYTKTKTVNETVTEDGYRVTYQTTTTETYDADGNLLYSKTSDPVEISREKLSGSDASPNKNLIAGTLEGELQRVSSKISYDTSKASQLLADLNADRNEEKLPSVKMNMSGDLYKLACVRAADMAIYDHASSGSPMYGTIGDMIKRWNLSLSEVKMNITKVSSTDAKTIDRHFQDSDLERSNRMDENITEAAIAIVEANGQDYIVELFA